MFSISSATRAAIAAGLFTLLSAFPTQAVTLIRTAAQEATEPKFVSINRDGESAVGGLCIDIMRAIERIEPSLKFIGDQVWQPLVRVEAGVASGDLDAACAFLFNKVRATKFVYVEPPLFPVNYYLVVRAADNVQVNNWDDVRKLGNQGVILVINGFGVIKKLEDLGGLKIDSGAKDSKTNLDKLLAERGRFYIHRSPGIKLEIRKAGAQNKVRLLPTVMHTENFHMVMAKTTSPEVIEKMRKAIAQLERSGELSRLFEKWETE